jgi:hypothetical protein
MSLERHHPNRDVDRNLDKARDLRSAHLSPAWPRSQISWRSHGAPGGEPLRCPGWICRCLQSASNPFD